MSAPHQNCVEISRTAFLPPTESQSNSATDRRFRSIPAGRRSEQRAENVDSTLKDSLTNSTCRRTVLTRSFSMGRSFRIAAIACMVVVLLPPCWCCSWSLTTTSSGPCCRTVVATPKRTCCNHASTERTKSERPSTPKTEKDCCRTAIKQFVRSEIELPDPLAATCCRVAPLSLRRNGVLRNCGVDNPASLGNHSLQIWYCSWQC